MGRFLAKGWLFFWLLVLLISKSGVAQEFSPRFKKFNNAEGLSQSVVISIFQDSKNFLWFGTEDGLNKFDGYNFRIYRYDPEDSASISDNWVERIHLEDRDGDIWMETGDQILNIFNPRTNRFKKIYPASGNEGLLPFRRILFIKQDRTGLVWISTEKGLFNVDKSSWQVKRVYVNKGNEARRFTQFFDDGKEHVWLGSNQGLLIWKYSAAPADSQIMEKHTDRPIFGIEQTSGKIWVVTDNEIIGYNTPSNYYKIFSFRSLLGPDKPVNERPKGMFAFVRKDSQQNLWICSRRGLVFFNAGAGNVKIYLQQPSVPESLSSNHVTSFYEDRKGNLWFGTTNGINMMQADGTFQHLALTSDSLSNNIISSIFEDKTGRIWVRNLPEQAEGAQLYYFDKKQGKFIQAKKRGYDPDSLPFDFVYEPFTDKQGNIWFGTYGAGVILYSPFQKQFETIKHIQGNNNTIAGNSIWGISEDSGGKLWLTLFNDGLDSYDPATGKTVHYRDYLRKITGSRNFNVLAVVCDEHDRVWVGTTGQGLICMDIKNGKAVNYRSNSSPGLRITSDFILAITRDRESNLLISSPTGGLDILNTRTGDLTNYRNIPGNPNSLYNNDVRYAIGTSDGNYWISCDGAITLFEPATRKMTHFASRKNGGKGILADKASCIFEDSKGNIWIGTHGGGLSLFDKKKQEFRHWLEKDGLINNVIYGILEDEKSNLWISTNKGISCFNPLTNEFTNYYANDGLQASEFNANSFYKDRTGKMYFGGINGVTTFYPNEIQKDPVPPQIAITGFQIFNKKVEVLPSHLQHLSGNKNKVIEVDGHLYLPGDIAYTQRLKLNYHYKVFTFEFAALRFDMPERCTYMYKMEGFENEWNIAGNRRFATYTNLPPGEYVFKVTAANADGIWNPEPARIEIVIKPPFYLTWWFISFAIASLIVVSTSIVMKREKNLKRTKSMLEEKVKLRTHELNEKNEELTLRNIQIMKQKEEIANQAKRLRVELDLQNQTSEQALLRSQINPHFLFNTLNNIYSLVYQKADTAPAAVMKLSDIMRYMLYDTSEEQVELEKEVQYLKSFVELHMLRLKNKDFVLFEINGDLTGRKIAPMLLIAFVENAFKHGNKSAPAPGIVIQLDCQASQIRFRVKNSKNNGAVKDSLGGIGLTNVKRRLELIYHDKYDLYINDHGNVFEVDLVILDK